MYPGFEIYSKAFRHFRPEHPDAVVFEVDAGMPEDVNVIFTAMTSEGEQSLMIARFLFSDFCMENGHA